ncbi:MULTISPECIES: copper homeostasis membrane protein CopD [unclassified Sphingopyxis]|uniref:copper homeostasis membrane protein CopD n=1 Tax=unclassified Sphingopyxis TaxID=2614943 RepID=UPI000730EF64|nr:MULTISPECIES: copper homeostasis membrane protein CopD [unclassified Sphingopyxis]KTE26976.1 copper resistance protein [Sphingopyxis sp. H057]KTE54283.1 copper resistance protein [Sphingopyxis sp. H073]KTE56604.1 copper resistance protein [Sphingopyxis sp. H071]KTE58365.1 copper resistance protein [Sphingopyxis sp. H107]KTE65827.1 copper resistance protein [Sphingopyxis sp. H081]
MGDPVLIGIRFALYAILMLIAGLAAFPLYALTRSERLEPQPMAALWRAERSLCAAGLLLSALGMGVLAASMQGVDLLSLEFQPFWDLVRETHVGMAWIYRSAALLLALAVAICVTRWPTTAAAILAAAGSVAVATLVWSGHAGATEGAAGTVHRASDILHLIAAAIWIGAIGAFLLLLSPRVIRESPNGLRIAARSLEQFSLVGTICVLVIAATGLINSQMIVGAENLGRSLGSPYGQLLLAKLALFGLMLALAAANRWRLTPALAAAVAGVDSESADPDQTLAAMRKSLVIEASAALAILALVAWFGTLEPFVGTDPV